MSAQQRRYENDEDEQAHREALKRDARDIFPLSEHREAVISKSATENNNRQAVTSIDNVYVFVLDEENELKAGDHIIIRFYDIQQNAAKALQVAKLD